MGDFDPNPMEHPEEQPSGADGSPKFGRLLIVLALAVALIGVLVVVVESMYKAGG